MTPEEKQKVLESRIFWGTLGGRWRGFVGGVFGGAAVGLAFGAVALALPLLFGVPLASIPVAGILGAFTAAGLMLGGVFWSDVGQISGGLAAAQVQKEKLETELAQNPGLTIEQALSPPPVKEPWFNKKVSAIGIFFGGLAGAFVAAAGAIGADAPWMIVGVPPPVTSGAVFAMLGAIFGMKKAPFKAIKRYTDGLFEGKLFGVEKAPTLAISEPTPDVALSTSSKAEVASQAKPDLDLPPHSIEEKEPVFRERVLAQQALQTNLQPGLFIRQ